MENNKIIWKKYLIKIGLLEFFTLCIIIFLLISMNNMNKGLDYIGEALAYALMYRGVIFVSAIIVFISLMVKIIKYKKSNEKGHWFIDILICILFFIGYRMMNIIISSVINDYIITKEYAFSFSDFISTYSRATFISLVCYIGGVLLICERFNIGNKFEDKENI